MCRWVLTPQPDMIPIDGSLKDVWVDGVSLRHPVYDQYRSDIANLFPGYAHSDGAVGYFNLDTTALANGIHTIQWTARNSCGDMDGISSRYFTVRNNASATDSVNRGAELNWEGAAMAPFHRHHTINFNQSFPKIRDLLP